MLITNTDWTYQRLPVKLETVFIGISIQHDNQDKSHRLFNPIHICTMVLFNRIILIHIQ